MQCPAEHDFNGVKELSEWLLVIDPFAVYLHHITLDIPQLPLKVPKPHGSVFWWEMAVRYAQHAHGAQKRLRGNQLTSKKDTYEINFERVCLTWSGRKGGGSGRSTERRRWGTSGNRYSLIRFVILKKINLWRNKEMGIESGGVCNGLSAQLKWKRGSLEVGELGLLRLK